MRDTNSSNSKRIKRDAKISRLSSSCSDKFSNFLGCSSIKKKVNTAWIELIQLIGDGAIVHDDGDADDVVDVAGRGVHGLPSISGCHCLSSILEPNQPYTIGRSHRHAHFIFKDSRVSKLHCQILFDAFHEKLYLLNGALLSSPSDSCSRSNICVVDQFRYRLLGEDKMGEVRCVDCKYKFKASLNGLFVNGAKVGEGLAVELSAGDEIMLVCANRDRVCGPRSRIGFIVRRVVFQEEVVIPGYGGFQLEWLRLGRPLLSGKVNKRVFALRVSDLESLSSESNQVVGRAKSLSDCCKGILNSNDPVSFIRQFVASYSSIGRSGGCISKEKEFPGFEPNDVATIPGSREPQVDELHLREQKPPSACLDVVQSIDILRAPIATDAIISCEEVEPSPLKIDHLCAERYDGNACHSVVDDLSANASGCLCKDGKNLCNCDPLGKSNCWSVLPPPPGRNFHLNCLKSMQQSSFGKKNGITLPELLHPVESISRMFIATFTSDIQWFLSSCGIPSHLPVTLACHNTERCWSANPEMRSSVPYTDFPNLVVVYPPFPEVIAFGNDRKRKGVGCHHPKLLVLRREDTLRVIITSANLVAKQWSDVTNTIWWEDFPRKTSPDCTPLFHQIGYGDTNHDSNSDFAAQLAGFMATLVTDVPSQAYWIFELAKYDFTGANAYLVASVPGIHSYKSPSAALPAYEFQDSEKFLGSVEASVVGLSHLFRATKDSNGTRLKKLAAYLAESSEKRHGMLEITLRRDKNVPADANAVSVLVPNPMDISKGDCVQLGFLPRAVAKWVSPLWDIGFFKFSGYICSRKALSAAFGEENIKVQLTIHVFQGPHFQDMPKMMEPERIVAFCSLIASLQRCTGLWRLEEVLQQYKWPEHLESDFIYGSSSIGTSVNAQFLATFSAAAGKKSQQLFDSEESDPEWGCWNASHELKHPSLKIIFPTIERVKSANCGILPFRRILCFSEKTWQRLRTVDILHDAVPNPCHRVGHPMHVKVARRRFETKGGGDALSSFGWIYCGSHNMSCAAWGKPICSRHLGQPNVSEKSNSSSQRLHVCNYELGVIFVFPPPWTINTSNVKSPPSNLDDIDLPFIVPAPKYGTRDRPATMRAMSEALAELAEREEEDEEMIEEPPDEEEEVQVVNEMAMEEDEDKAYADVLWSQVELS